MNLDEAREQACEMLRSDAQRLLEAQCAAIQEIGAASTSFTAMDTGVEDQNGRTIRAVLFLTSGTFTDDELRRMQEFCLAMTQDATQGAASKLVASEDNLPPRSDGGDT